jgi:transcriptional regulator with XRE-family HTH domain
MHLYKVTKMNSAQLRMARAALKIGVRDLAAMSGVTANTISRIENESDAKQSTMKSLQTALESAGVEFIDGGVRLRDK